MWAYGAAAAGAAMLLVYLTLIFAQDGSEVLRALPWALLMAIAVGAALWSAQIGDRRVARNLMIVTVVLYAVIGVLALFTIGIGFLLAAVVATVAVFRN